jgi:hypothetical protein
MVTNTVWSLTLWQKNVKLKTKNTTIH